MSEQDYEQLTLFPADSPASRFPWQESKKEKGMIVTYGLRCSELSESCARIALSVRTFFKFKSNWLVDPYSEAIEAWNRRIGEEGKHETL